MSAIAATADLPLYLQMGRYAKGSQALFELRAERFRAEQAEKSAATADAPNATGPGADDAIITGSIGEEAADDGLAFGDLVDALNPLQHLPGISSLYRGITGDEISAPARIVGGAIFGGPIGAGLSIAESILEEATGSDVGGHVMAWFGGTPVDEPQGAAPDAEALTLVATTAGDQQPQAPGAPLPSLSPDAFNALLALDTKGPGAAASVDVEADEPEQEAFWNRTREPVDVAAAMELALERYGRLQENRQP